MNKKIVVIKGGPLKTRVVNRAFSSAFPEENFEIISLDSPSSDAQVISKNECQELMREKVLNARKGYPDASYFVFMRGRFDDDGSKMEECALVMVQDQFGNEGVSQAASFEVPESLAIQVRQQIPWSKAVEKVYNVSNVKEGSGFVGILTKDSVTKEEQYFQPTVIALNTVLNKFKSRV